MHYYKRNLGDYAKKAGRLSMLQHGSYTLLIDACYDRERFPTADEAIEWTWASTKEEIEAVTFVLRKFFALENGVYVQNRIREEIESYNQQATTNKRIATERETKRSQNNTHRARSVNEASEKTNDSPPNHKPLTTNQEPLTNNHKKDISAFAENENPEPSPAESLFPESPQSQTPRSAKKPKSKPPDLPGFDQFWEIYPKQRKGNRENAKAAYHKAVQRGSPEMLIIAGCVAYADSREVAEGFAKGAAAWLNDDRFLNDYSEGKSGKIVRRGSAAPTKTDRLAAVLEAAKRNINSGVTGFGRPTPDGGNSHAMLPGPEPLRQGAGTISGGDPAVSDGPVGLFDQSN